jgi:hypothetical protein
VLPVRLELGGRPALADLPILFDTGTWSVHQAGEETLLRLRGAGESGPFLDRRRRRGAAASSSRAARAPARPP